MEAVMKACTSYASESTMRTRRKRTMRSTSTQTLAMLMRRRKYYPQHAHILCTRKYLSGYQLTLLSGKVEIPARIIFPKNYPHVDKNGFLDHDAAAKSDTDN